MGRVTSEPKKETPTTVTHFSHPHPLKLITTTDHHHQQQQTLNLSSSSTSSCSGCNLDLSGTIYSCTVCKDFSLHKKCFDMPMKITHPFHKEHALTLLPEPTYDEGLFKCDACGEAGKCFSYHCEPCGVDLHVLCAAVPLTLTRASHHMHKLDLIFESPYDTKDFSCDVCKKPGGDHWLYRCSPCEFDAHLSCAAIVPAPPPVCPPPPVFPPPPVAPPPLQQNVHSNFIGLQSQTLPPQQLTEFTKSVPPPPPQMQGFRPQYGGAPPPPQMQGLGPQYGGAPPPPPPQTQGFAPHFGGAPPPPPPHLHGFPPQFGAAPPSPQMRGYRALAPPSVQQNYGPPPPMMNNHAVGVPTGGPNHHQQLVANKQHGEYLSSYNGTLHRIMSNGSVMGQAAATLAGGVVGVGASFAGHLGGVGSDKAQKQMISPIHNGGGSGGIGIGSVIHGVNAIGGGVGGLIPSMDSFGGGGGDGGGLDMVASLLGDDGGGLDIIVGALGCLAG